MNRFARVHTQLHTPHNTWTVTRETVHMFLLEGLFKKSCLILQRQSCSCAKPQHSPPHKKKGFEGRRDWEGRKRQKDKNIKGGGEKRMSKEEKSDHPRGNYSTGFTLGKTAQCCLYI